MRLLAILLATLLTLLQAPLVAASCTDTRAGGVLTADWLDPDTFLVTCWPVKVSGATTITDPHGHPLTFSQVTAGLEVLATGCLDGDGFTLLADTVVVGAGASGGSAPEVFVAFSTTGMASWGILATTDPSIAALGSANPTLSLTAGTRYTFSYTNPGSHPFALIAKGATSAGDTPLLVVGATVGTMEADPGVAWVDNGTDFSFTLTPELADALAGSGVQEPGYRCNVHVATMRGSISILPTSSVADWANY